MRRQGRYTYVTINVLETDALELANDVGRHGGAYAEVLPEPGRLARARVAPELDVAVVADDAVINPAVAVDVGQPDAVLLSLARHDHAEVLKGREAVGAAAAVAAVAGHVQIAGGRDADDIVEAIAVDVGKVKAARDAVDVAAEVALGLADAREAALAVARVLPDAEAVVIRAVVVPAQEVVVLPAEQPGPPPLVTVPRALDLEDGLNWVSVNHSRVRETRSKENLHLGRPARRRSGRMRRCPGPSRAAYWLGGTLV